MDDSQTPTPPSQPPSANDVPPSVSPQAEAEEEEVLKEVHTLESEEKTEVAADAAIINQREEAGKEMEAEEKTDQNPATPAQPEPTSNNS